MVAGAARASDGPEARPNVLLLLAEDLGPRVGAFGDPVAVTPNLDRLAAEGTRYTRVFTTAGVCAPSRAALLTGVHAISTGSQHMRTSDRDYRAVPPPEVKAFPELLRAAGYATYTDFKLDYQFSGTMAGSGPFTIWDAEGLTTHWRELDGRVFAGPSAGPPRRYVFASRDRINAHEDRQRAVRDERYKYVRSYHAGTPGAFHTPWRDVLDTMRELWAHHERGELDPVASLWFEPRPAEALFDTSTDPH